MDKDYTLDQLPEHILIDIFEFVPENAYLRRVCKTFKNIIDNSAKLMRNKWFVVDQAFSVDPMTINHYYQNLKLTDLSFEKLNWLCNYQHKDRIKTVKMKCINKGIVRPLSAQYVITNFNFMETLYIEPNCSDNVGNPPITPVKLIPNKHSNLKTLHIGYIDHSNNVLDMLSEIPTIKNLYIHDFYVLQFPNDVKWKLEKLILTDLYTMGIDDDNCKQFLLSQQSTLKKLTLPECVGYRSFIMRNLPNLESLTLGLENDEDINTELMITNGRLERLFLERFFWETNDMFKAMLNHYNKIKYLSIDCNHHFKTFNMKLPNVTHLMLKKPNSLPFLNGSFPNLKVFGITLLESDDKFNLNNIPSESLKNIEKFSFQAWNQNDIFKVIKKCPQLVHLNLDIIDWTDEQSPYFVSNIDRILEVLPQLKCLGLTDETLSIQNVKYDEFLSYIRKKSLKLKIYENFESMIAEDWGCEDTEIINM